MRNGAEKEALGYFNRALEINPDSASALAGQSIVLYYSGDEQAATEAAFRAGEIDPNNPYAAFAVGNIYSNTSDHYDPQAALEWFSRAVDGCGDDAFLCAEALGEKASIESWDLGDFEAGVADVSRAIEIDPDQDSASYRISTRADMVYSGLGDADSAFADLEHAYEINPDYSFIQQAARIAIEIGDLDRAHGYFERLIADHNGEPAFVAGRGYIELLQGSTGDAHASADRALALNPDLLPGHYLLGLVLLEEGNPHDAIGHFQFITEREDEWYNDAQYTPGLFTSHFGHELYYDLARATWGNGDPDGALGLIEAAIEREDWTGPFVLRGDILAEQGDLAGAREAYLTALDYAYDDPDLQSEIQDRLAALSGG